MQIELSYEEIRRIRYVLQVYLLSNSDIRLTDMQERLAFTRLEAKTNYWIMYSEEGQKENESD